MFFMTVFPGFMLIDWVDPNSWNPDKSEHSQVQASAAADSDSETSSEQTTEETQVEDRAAAHEDLRPGPFSFAFYFFLAIPAGLVLTVLTILLAAGLRRLLVSRQKTGVFSVYGLAYCRTWLLYRVLDGSLGVLHGIYASMFAPPWLR